MNNIIYYALMLVSICLNGGGGMLMKLGSKNVPFGEGEGFAVIIKSMIFNWQLIVGMALYASSFMVSTIIYTKIALNIAYPIMMAGTLLFVTIGAVLFLDEGFNRYQFVGSIFLLLGIGMIAGSMRG